MFYTTLLDQDIQPTAIHFDVSNKEHRRLAMQYLNTRAWKHTNVRFFIDRGYTNIVTMITTKLALYYTNREFADDSLPVVVEHTVSEAYAEIM